MQDSTMTNDDIAAILSMMDGEEEEVKQRYAFDVVSQEIALETLDTKALEELKEQIDRRILEEFHMFKISYDAQNP